MNTSLLRMRKAIASFTIGTLLASFLAVPAAFAAGTPEWAMEGANAYLKAETRDQGYVLANKCEVATMIANALDLPMGDTEAQRGAEFQDLQGGMAWCQAAAGAVANTGIATGNGDMFGAAGSVSRAVVATMLVRAFQLDAAYQPASLSAERQAEFAGLEWAQEPMALGVAAGIINGDAEGRLLPMEGASKWAVATMLYRAANMGAEEATEEATEETTEEAPATPEVAPTGGALTVSLSDNSPSLDNLGSEDNTGDKIDGATVAVFELTAGSDDVRVNSIRLHEIGGNSVFGPIALFDADGMRVSREKSFNNDREANVSLLNGGINIPAGSSVELYVRASVDKNKGSATAALAIESPDDISSNASSTSVSNATTELARLSLVKVAEFKVANSGSTPDVSVGDRRAQVARFEMTSGDEDMHLHSITLEQFGSINAETEMSNYVLEIEGQEVASTPYAVDNYVSFLLDTPYEIEEDDTAQARVYADILDGAGDDIEFRIESDLDVLAIDQAVKQPANVDTSGLGTAAVSVQAGELTIVASDASFTEFGRDQQNLVLGYVDITPASGESIELKNITLGISGNNKQISTAIDVTTVEAVTENGTFDLAVLTDTSNGAGGAADNDCIDSDDVSCTFQAKNIDLAIKPGSRVWFRADSQDTAGGFASDVTLSLSLSNLGTGLESDGLYFKEVNDDTVITDITPSAITFEDVTSEVASATIRSQAQSAAKTVVQGTDGVVLMKFEIEAGDASYLDIDTLQIAGAHKAAAGVANAEFQVAATQLDSDYIDSVRIYHTSENDAANLIDEQGGNEFAAGLLEFDFNDYRIAAGETTSFVVVADINDNDSIAGHYLKIAVDKATIRDSENDTVALNNATDNINEFDNANELFDADDMELSRREVKVAGAGTFTSTIDNTDSRTDRNSYVLAGTAGIIGSVELSAENEDLTLEDFSITFSGISDSNAQSAFSEVRLLDSDLSVLATSTVSGTRVEFTNEEIELTEGTRNLYIEVVTNPVGKDKAGIQSATNVKVRFSAEEVRGQSLLANEKNVIAGDTFTVEFADAANVANNLSLTINGETLNAAGDNAANNGAQERTNFRVALDAALGGNLNGVVTAADLANGGANNQIEFTALTNLTVSGATSALTVTGLNANPFVDATTYSNEFGVLPVHITDARLNTNGVSSSLSSDTLLAQLELDNASHSNTFAANTTKLRTQVESLKFNVRKLASTELRNVTLDRSGISTTRLNGYNLAAGNHIVLSGVANATTTLFINGVEVSVNAAGAINTTITALDARGDALTAAGQPLEGLVTFYDRADEIAVARVNTVDADTKIAIIAEKDVFISTNLTNLSETVVDNWKKSNVYFKTTELSTEANLIDSGLTATYRVYGEVEVDGADGTQDYVRLSMDDTSASAVVYSSEDTGTDITDLRITETNLRNTDIK